MRLNVDGLLQPLALLACFRGSEQLNRATGCSAIWIKRQQSVSEYVSVVLPALMPS